MLQNDDLAQPPTPKSGILHFQLYWLHASASEATAMHTSCAKGKEYELQSDKYTCLCDTSCRDSLWSTLFHRFECSYSTLKLLNHV